ncbi:Riean_0653 family protein [Hymenobacter ruber]
MRFSTFLTYLSLLPLSACTRSCNDYDNNEEFAKAKLPPYTETGAMTMGCVLGSQTWTVLGSTQAKGPLGSSWQPNTLQVDGSYSVPPFLNVSGQMTGVRDSKPFYDMQLNLLFRPSDTLGGLHLLGADTSRYHSGGFVEQMRAMSFLNFEEYTSSNRRPVRLLVRRLNRQQRTISGTFEGYLYGGASGHDSLAVTDGRFDIKY